MSFDRDIIAAINISLRGLSRQSGGGGANGIGDVVIYRNSDVGRTTRVAQGDILRVQKDIMAV